jgi:class 3 adenylate cyclase
MVNLASRLAGLAGPGEILISGSTLGLVGPGINARPSGERALKGFSSEIEVFAVESLAQEDPSSGGSSARASA